MQDEDNNQLEALELRIDIMESSDELLDEIRASLPSDSPLIVTRVETKASNLTGQEAASWIALAVASGVLGNLAYDSAKVGLLQAANMIGHFAKRKRKKTVVVWQGVSYPVESESDAVELLAIISDDIATDKQ